MPLATDTIRITLDGHAVVLRPSLRAATLLEARHGFRTVFEGISSGSLTIMADVIEIAGDHPGVVASIIREVDHEGILRLDMLKGPLMALLTQLVGVDDNKGGNPEHTGEAQPFGSYYEHLFKIGTGWLGWTPAETWAATPAEIAAAYDGRIELLKAIFGSGEKQAEPAPSKETLGNKVKAIFAGLGTTKIKREA